MTLEVQFKLKSNPLFIKYLHENSYWYKYLNRSESYYKDFINDMKDKYKLKPTDKINKMVENIDMIRTFLDVLK